MGRNFGELEAKMTAAEISASDERVKQMAAEMPLNRLRAARKLTQEHARIFPDGSVRIAGLADPPA
jgi:hypothetical protein